MTPNNSAREITQWYADKLAKEIDKAHEEGRLAGIEEQQLQADWGYRIECLEKQVETAREEGRKQGRAEAFEESAEACHGHECAIARFSETCNCAEELESKIRAKAKGDK